LSNLILRKVSYEVAGQGHPLLLLHAGVADNRMWDDQFAEFGRYYQVIRLDLRGFGQTLVPPGKFSHHNDIAGLLNFLGIAKSYVVGMSFGGRVGLDFTLAYPEMVTALILSAPAVSGYEPSSEEMRRFFAEEEAALERGDLAAATELNLCMWVDGPHRTPDQVNPLVRERVREMQWNIFALPIPDDVEYEPLLPPALARLAEIQIPTLVIVGELEVPEFIGISELVTAGIAGAQKVIIPGVAHLPGLEKPELFNKIVLDFLSGQ
jgi:pimeloyl-ACP methyl ester carboxylesterase